MPEIIGRFTICNGEIDTPPGFEGEYILETTKNGSFIYRPVKEIIENGVSFVVWDDINPDVTASFLSEAQAVDYKNKMEKFFKKPFHMKKMFPSAEKNGKLV
ncbi:MAG: hypothetical protein WCX79_00215 [Candidatus Paceibacterota bacterium]|jgi:hypothetical protein